MDPDQLNSYFSNQVNCNTSGSLLMTQSCNRQDSFQFHTLSTATVQHLLSSVKTNTAPGHDGISGSLVKRLASSISPNITRIMNSSITECVVPSLWKKANISAVWKGKGSKTEPSNYRPISVLPILARMLEKVCAKQLNRYVEEKMILPKEQFGFRDRSSCEVALVSGLDSWLGEVDKGQMVGALLLDMSKAFDTVPHQMLLAELEKIGCGLDSLRWFHDYLTNRKQMVVLDSKTTNWQTVGRGVPQGSCLSPLLFNIFVRELPANCTSATVQFADDVTHSEANHGQCPTAMTQNLAESFAHTKNFCVTHELKINAAKTQFIVFKSPNKKLPEDFHITLDGCEIRPSNNVKLLGVTLDQHLTFKDHIDQVCRKCHGLLGVLNRSAPFLSKELLRMAFISLVRLQLEYCSATFAPAARTHLQKLQTIQKIASRIICRQPRNSHSEPLLQSLCLDPLDERRSAHTIALVKQMIANDCHPAVCDMFRQGEDGKIYNDNTSRLQLGKRRFSIFAKQLYNSSL